MKPKALLPVIVASVLLLAAIAHVGVLATGARGAVSMGAPTWILDSMNRGTWLAPAVILSIACVLTYAAACVLSLAELIKQALPWRRTFVVGFGVALLLRGAALPAIALLAPSVRSEIGLFETSTAAAAALLGLSILAVLARSKDKRQV